VTDVHRLIEELGHQGALKTAETSVDRRAIEAAIGYMSDEEAGVGFLYSGWCQAALPHKRLADDQVWKTTTERVTLVVEPGRRNLAGKGMAWVGVPYGSRARLILLYLQSEALRTRSRDIELGRSLHAWPLEEAAIRAISNNSQALDVYCWLAYRLHVLPQARTVSWGALYAQFGSSYKRLAHFKIRFVESLKIAIAVYRDADVELVDRGLILKPSRPPVAPRLVVAGPAAPSHGELS